MKRIFAAMTAALMMVALGAGAAFADVNAVTPSTNDINRTNGWAHVVADLTVPGQATLTFTSTRAFSSCFEYRTDGDTSQQTSPTNYNPLVTDGLYPFYCQNNSTRTVTIPATGYVEVRMVFGAETDERFDWTQFNVMPVPEPATVRLIKNVLPADDSLWNFVITNGNDKTYQTYTDRSAPFDSGVLTIANPTAIEIDEWAGTGTDIADYSASVVCTDEGTAFTPTASSYYDVGTQHRFYVYFIPAQPGHDYVCTFTNTNPYDFTGFFAPVDNLPAVNVVKAGSAIPVKFSLDGYQGLDIFAAGYPKSITIACDSNSDLVPIEETVTAGASSLSYDSLIDQYNYVWKTNKAWSGTCRQLVVGFDDGTFQYANFKFK